MILDLFAGPGGWDEGARGIGVHVDLGIEWDKHACATAEAAGHARLQADIAALNPRDVAPNGLVGLIASPPCQAWSMAGKRGGEEDRAACHELADRMAAGDDSTDWTEWADPRSALVCQPVRWARDLMPEWIALEEVPAVLGLWEHFGRIFTSWGYHVWTGVLNAANYGIIDVCPLHAPKSTVASAESRSRYVTDLAYVAGPAMTQLGEVAASLAVTVAVLLDRAIRPAFVGSATCDERERALQVLAASVDLRTQHGSEVATWTIEATSRFGLTTATVESIASLLNNYLDESSVVAKLSTISMETRRTIVHRISRSIAATIITSSGTGLAARQAGCGLCVDTAVPQTRKRAFLIASRVQRVAPPMPTHSKHADMFSEPWVSMAEALGWDDSALVGFPRRSDGQQEIDGYRARDLVPASEPAHVITEKARSWSVLYVASSQANAARRPITEPAPTVMFGAATNDVRWCYERPATTIVGSFRPDVVAAPGYRTEVSRQDAEGSVRVSVQEAAILQSFPADYPWRGSRTRQFLQVGNAVPPLLSAHVLRAAGAIAQEAAA